VSTLLAALVLFWMGRARTGVSAAS
jgi:hypothetical protein